MMTDIEANRRAVKWTKRELLQRMLWMAVQPFFRCSPRLFWGWRRFMLRLFGAKVGNDVRIDPSALIFIPWNLDIGDWSSIGFDALIYNLGPTTIGSKVTISQRSHLCGGSHDFRGGTMELLKMPIEIHDEAWVCADAFVGPGVVIGHRAIVGACAVVTKNIEAGRVVGGNPAREIGQRDTQST